MLNAIKRVHNQNMLKDDYKMLYPLMIWSSGNEKNFEIASKVNRMFFTCDSRILINVLSIGLKYRGFTPYMKAKKFDATKYDIVLNLLKKKYYLGTNDVIGIRKYVEHLTKDKVELNKLANEFGLDNKERKKLGLDTLKMDKTKMKKIEKRGKSLF